MIFGIPHDDDAASTGFDFDALRDALYGIVGALGMKIGTDFANQGAHVCFWKDYNGIDVGESRENFCAFFRRHDGAAFTFQRTDGRVGVYGYDQFATQFSSGVQVAYVANVEQIEASVGQRDAIAVAAPSSHTAMQFIARDNLLMECGFQGFV